MPPSRAPTTAPMGDLLRRVGERPLPRTPGCRATVRRMEQWKHLRLSVENGGSVRQYVLVPYQPDIDLPRVTDEHTVQVLNDLGFEGWQLVSADTASDIYWLKRRRDD